MSEAPTTPPPIVAYTGEDGRFIAVRERAIELARERGAGLLLYDGDAASPFSSPIPTNWSAEGTEVHRDRLEPDDLDAAGRASLARQVREARDAGVEAWGWLPTEADTRDLAAYAESQRASLILVPDELEEPGLLDRLQGRSAERAEETTRVPVEVVRTRDRASGG
jgi:hypothetical protein